jgi:hypothetical protein
MRPSDVIDAAYEVIRQLEDAAYDRGRKDGGSLVADTTEAAVEKFKARIAELEAQLKQVQKAIVNQFDEGRNCAREAAAKRIAELESDERAHKFARETLKRQVTELEGRLNTRYQNGYDCGLQDGMCYPSAVTQDRIVALESQLAASNQRAVEREKKIAELKTELEKPSRWVVLRESAPNDYGRHDIVYVKRTAYTDYGMMIFI